MLKFDETAKQWVNLIDDLKPVSTGDLANSIYNPYVPDRPKNSEASNLQLDYQTVHHTCGVNPQWYPGAFGAPSKDSVYIPNQQPKQSENMVLVDAVTSTRYLGGKSEYEYYDQSPYPVDGTKEEKAAWSEQRDKDQKEMSGKIKDALKKEADSNQPNLNLTYQEQLVLLHSKQAWQAFMSLSNKSEDDILEFKDAIHRLQQIIALRVARRVDTAVWLQPS